jgi:hypothetical protein
LRVAVVRSEKLVSEAGDSSGTKRKGEHPPSEAITKQQPAKTEKCSCFAVVTVIFGMCNSVRLS